MSKIIIESKPCSNDGYTVITVKGKESDELARRIQEAVNLFEIERSNKQA